MYKRGRKDLTTYFYAKGQTHLSFLHNLSDYWFVRSLSPLKENNALGADCFMGYVAFVCCCIYTVWKKFLDKKLNIFYAMLLVVIGHEHVDWGSPVQRPC